MTRRIVVTAFAALCLIASGDVAAQYSLCKQCSDATPSVCEDAAVCRA